MKKFIFHVPKGSSKVLKAKKIILLSRCGMSLFIILFLSELDPCLPNLIPTRGTEHCEKIYFLQGNMLKFKHKGHSLTTNKKYQKLLHSKSKQWAHALVPTLHTNFSFLKKTQNLNFGEYFKVPQANCLWANFCNFGICSD
jgi:hypothetical protein